MVLVDRSGVVVSGSERDREAVLLLFNDSGQVVHTSHQTV